MRFSTFVAQLAMLAALAPSVFAAPPATTPEAKTYKEAVRLESDGDVVSALAKFESIPEARRDFLVRLHVASCKRKLGRFLASTRDLEAIVADPKADTATRETAQSDLDDLRARTPRIAVRLSAATTGVRVTLDGEAIEAPAGRALDPGAHVVVATRAGTQVFRREVQLAEATTIDVEIDAPGARVEAAPVPPATTVPTSPVIDASPPSGQRTTGWVMVAVGGVIGLGAAGAWWKSNAAYDDWKASCGLTGCDDAKASTVRAWDRTKIVGTGVAVAAVGVGVALLVSAPRESTSLSVRTSAGAFNGVVIEGRF